MFQSDPKLHIGTSSWSSKDWVGPFYPEGTRPEAFIEHYATRYDTVEIDATFYRMPTVRNVAAWKRRTPEGFTFAVKTPRIITHEKQLEDADVEMTVFLDTISGLDDRLGPILLQFPYFSKKAFPSKAPFLERLDRFLGRLPKGIRVAVAVLSALRAKQIEIFGYFDNPFAGHGPGSVEMLRRLYPVRGA